MRTALLGCLAFLALSGCQPSSSPGHSPSALATPDRVGALISKAQTARKAGQRETEAVALREAVDLLGASGDARLEEARAECVQAMVEAGDNVESFRLWSGLAKKKGAGEEAGKMRERARKLMLQQAGELADQVELDLKAHRPQAALCTAKAALALCAEAGSDAALLKRAQAALKKAESSLPAGP